jgi:hypothetical protein
MAELFASNQLGTLPEERWREWGDAVSGIGYFESSGIADTRNFDTWQDWAFHMVGTMTIIGTASSTNAVA